MTATADLAVTVWPGIEARLLRTGAEDYADYRAAGGYQRVDASDGLLSQIDLSGVLGRGGAAFPLAVKLKTVRDNGREAGGAVVVANGEEGEPASIKDRWLLRNRPHLVLDGLRLAAQMVSAERAHVYVSDRFAADSVRSALAELDDEVLGGLSIDVLTVAAGYVAGEESAAVRALNGGPAKPTDKPPRPFEEGVGGLPTIVSNVETLALIPFIARHGAEAFRQQGTSASPGTFLATITGAGRPAALYEIPHGLPFADLLEFHGVPADQVAGVLMGGYFAGLLNRDVLDITLDHESLRRLDSGLGCGAITILTDDCPLAVAAAVMSYFDRENAGQCGSCFNGTAAMSAVTEALRDGVATGEDLARLERWSVVLRGRGACATLDAATNVAASLLSAFPQVVERHLNNDCETCRAGAYKALRPYEIEAVL
ncbi:NADH-ubiquinone oxidoreductase-F iron-sulfur binding region domain-containing protein [Mycolicibacterium sp. 120270]|uniref:NADH-ubiquinone oxidoreductase-F iron-sulfur binding region domain-containing protein n=1 Tax=Mycolicibacterium sp. 120270 TaxID=3090600 RepID=UPI00299E1E4A|nr:NADH-ubiquinone oxidoreductase-F iron-sulfur binding region domain-containing protein [Mycolicibacterium sp. 120270]MDX1884252.1 NADH-ubiquinone oxidoreductase-F iron-sulfur binding region domain-containing protein [Mycolicibacterium sp. 120270]